MTTFKSDDQMNEKRGENKLVQDYRKGTYIKITFDNKKLEGFFRAWVDCKNEKALVIDQTYLQHIDFMKQLYHLNDENPI